MDLIKVEATYTPEVALEGIVSMADKSFSSVVDGLRSYLPSLASTFTGVTESISKLKAIPSDVINSLSVGYSRSVGKELDFNAFGKVGCRVPESFSGNLREYAGFLKRSWEFINLEALPKMDILYGQLASFASNKQSKISLANTSAIFNEVQTKYEELAKESQIYFGNNRHNNTKSDLGTAYGDYGSQAVTESIIASLAKGITPRQINEVLSKIKRISSVLDIIINDAKAHEYDKASYEAVKGMSTGVYAMAQAMEFFSVTYYRINEMAVVCKENKAIANKLK